jgi:glycosyltransferase involved in cell wall biosynthesis
VRALAGTAVSVTGTVADVRPYLQHAAVVVAPLRLTRGIQNKILEAMAMARPVVAARRCVEAIAADLGTELLVADCGADYVR